MPRRGRRLVPRTLLAAAVLLCVARTAGAQSTAASLTQLAKSSLSRIDGTLRAPGLKEEVEVLRDRWGVPHIYAKNMDDLFFAQGYVQAQDRLWQMEMWRRIGDGTLAEVIGPSAVARDQQARLLMYRGAFDGREYASYHPEGKRIFEAFARGVNAYIAHSATNLPVEFKLTGIKPQLWTSRTPLLRRTTEPMLPGVLFGHNDHIGWALTIVGTDQGDVFVNEVNPANRNQIRWKGAWEELQVVRDTIRVKDAAPRIVELKFSRHGPVFYEDTVNHLNYAYRAVDNEPGSAGYLGALKLDQVGNCRDFLTEVLARFKAPTENMVCGDDAGNIAWMAAALSPKRAGGWDGRLPVPGSGAYEWAGFRDDLPREYNPARGFINTANHDIHPPGFDPPLFFKTGDFPRYERIYQLLSAGNSFTVEDFERMQHDTYWAAAAGRQELLQGWTGSTPELETARALVAGWDRFYERPSVAASVYDVWNRRLAANRVTADLARPTRDSLAQRSLREALDSLSSTFHTPWMLVNWGKINRSEFPHQFAQAYDIPTVERRGGAGTVAAFGATIRQITDFSNYDNSVQMNTPGQSGQPGSPFYGDLARSSANAEYFPQLWTRPAVERVVAHRLRLVPGGP